MWAADALGKMRSKAAAAKLKGMLVEQEAATRAMYIRALISIGDASAVPSLAKAAQAGSWDAREPAIIGVAMLGSGDDLKLLEKLAADEAKIHAAYCKEDPEYGACKDVAAGAKKNVEAIQKHMKRLQAAKACGSDLACWAKKLDDAEAGVRERAAYELGRGGDAKYIDVLVKRLSDENLETRAAAITAADWLISDSAEAFKTARGSLEAIEKQLEAESGKTTYVKVNEDLRRLAVKLARDAA
jgi:HEAT repeat protein